MEKVDLLIIGSGPSGLYAKKMANQKKISSLMIDTSDIYGGQLSKYYPTKIVNNIPFIFNKTAKEIVDDMYKIAFENTNDKILYNTKILKLNYTKKNVFEVLLSNKETIETRKIIICTGNGDLQPINSFNEEFDNLYFKIKDFTEYKDKKIVVLGGGASAVDFCIEFIKVSKYVTLIHRRDEFRAAISDVEEAAQLGVKIITDSLVVDKTVTNNLIKKIKVENKNNKNITTIECDIIVMAYGFEKSNFNPAGISLKTSEENKKILVDKEMQTNVQGIFACGDCCKYEGKINNIVFSMAEVNKAILNIEKELNNKGFNYSPW